MKQSVKKKDTRFKKKRKIRSIILGTSSRPRLSVFKSAKHIYVQAIDDIGHKTLCSASTLDKEFLAKSNDFSSLNKTEKSIAIGKAMAERMKNNRIESAVFDRNGFLYHGRIKSLADSIREGGITF